VDVIKHFGHKQKEQQENLMAGTVLIVF